MAVRSRRRAWSAGWWARIARKRPLLIGVLGFLLFLPAGPAGAWVAKGTANPTADAASSQDEAVARSRDGKVSYIAHTPGAANSRSGGRSGHVGSGSHSTLPSGPTASSGPTPDNVIYNTWGVVADTTVYPDSAVVYLTLEDNNTTTYCTGFMISPDFVATAGHCVYDFAAGNWTSAVTIAPARNVNSYPYGICGWTTEYTMVPWTDYGDEDYDYGGIKLDCTIGNSTGWFGMYWDTDDGDYIAKHSFLTGYPGAGKPDGQMWSGDGSIIAASAYQLEYNMDTLGGDSGAPVYETRTSNEPACQGWCAMAIHILGGNLPAGNTGLRITQDVYNNLISWSS